MELLSQASFEATLLVHNDELLRKRGPWTGDVPKGGFGCKVVSFPRCKCSEFSTSGNDGHFDVGNEPSNGNDANVHVGNSD